MEPESSNASSSSSGASHLYASNMTNMNPKPNPTAIVSAPTIASLPPAPVPLPSANGTTPSAPTNTASNAPIEFLPLYDAFLDLPHPASSEKSNVNYKRFIIAPPQDALFRSKDVGVELATCNKEGMSRVFSFCFPDYNAVNYPKASGSDSTSDLASDSDLPTLTKSDIYLQDYYFSPRSPGPTFHSFVMTLASGVKVYGHVRRYLPHHNVAKGRIDVGRRSERAMVILTRTSGGNAFYNSLLKTMDAISSNIHASFHGDQIQTLNNNLERFLHQVHTEHALLASSFQESLTASSNASTLNIGLEQLEINHALFANVDMTKFIVPTSIMLLQQQQQQSSQVTSSSHSPILPLLRCLGVAHTLRLLSALLSERRIIFVSSSTTKLTTCMNSLTSILSQGCLSWEHIFIPILPRSMLDHLAAPMPYLIGVQQLDQVSELGEALAVYLDTNEFKIFGISDPDTFIPEILSNENQYQYYGGASNGMGSPYGMDPVSQQYGYTNQNGYNNYHPQQQQQQQLHGHHSQHSIADILKTDLITILKEDKKSRTTAARVMATSRTVGAAAVKGKDLFKKGLGKLKLAAKKVGNMEQPRSSNNIDGSIAATNTTANSDYYGSSRHGVDPPGNESAVSNPIRNELYEYNDGYMNEAQEEEVRIAFTVFFLGYIGDMKGYLRPRPHDSPPGPPTFDRDLFKSSRIKIGEYENSPMYKLTVHFKESQMFEQFVNARVDDLSQRRTFSPRISPLFLLALHYHNAKRLPFRSSQIRSVVKGLARNRPVQELMHQISYIRAKAIALTSNDRNEGLARAELPKLVSECRECNVTLVEVMSVIWDRLRDSRGMQWKHGLYALQIIKDLIFHGPLAAVTEATDGLDKIRRMKSYENIMSKNAVQEIRRSAKEVYQLLVDRRRLFAMRRICAQRRREESTPKRYKRVSRFDLVSNKRLKLSDVPFKILHELIKPKGLVGNGVDLLGVGSSKNIPAVVVPPDDQQLPSANPSFSTELNELNQLMQNTCPPAAAPSNNSSGTTSTVIPTMQAISEVVAPSAPTNQHQASLSNLMRNTNISSTSNEHNQQPRASQSNYANFTNPSAVQGYSSQRNVVSPQTVPPQGQQNFGYPPQQQHASLSHPPQYANQIHQPQQQALYQQYVSGQNLQAQQPLGQQIMDFQQQSNATPTTPSKTKPSQQFDPFA